MHKRSTAVSIFLVFFFESSVLGQWIPRIPDIKTQLALTDATLGIALLALPLGTLLGFSIVGKIIEHIGLRNSCRFFLPLWARLVPRAGVGAESFSAYVYTFRCGVAVGMIETAMNTEAARIEKDSGTRLMSRCHVFGAWEPCLEPWLAVV